MKEARDEAPSFDNGVYSVSVPVLPDQARVSVMADYGTGLW